MNDDSNPEATRDPETLPEVSPENEDTAVPSETSYVSPAQKRSPKFVIAAIIAAVIVILTAVGVFGYTLWYQNPDKVVHDAVLNMIQAKAISSTGTVTYRNEGVVLDIGLDGGYGDSGGELSVAATMTIETDQMKQDFEATGVGRFIDDTLYIKLSGIEAIVEDVTAESNGQIPAYAQSIYQKIDDKWISIKASDYKDIDESIARQQECVTNLIKKIQTEDDLSKGVMDLYKKNQIVVIDEELGSKNINNTESLGFKVSIDKSAAKSFTEGLNDTNFGKELKECDDTIDFNDIAEDFTENNAEDNRSPSVDLWVSRNGHEFTEISIHEESEKEKESLNITLQPTFNTPTNVEVPSDATSFETILEEIQQVILEFYNEAYAPAAGTLPEGFNSNLDAELLPAA